MSPSISEPIPEKPNENGEEEEQEDEEVPTIITPEYFKSAMQKNAVLIRELRENGQYNIANSVIKIVSLCENLQFNLIEEKQNIVVLTEQFVDSTGRIENALEISYKDQNTIAKLKEEVENAWSVADASTVREQHAHETLNNFRIKYQKLEQETKFLLGKVEGDEQLGSHKRTVVEECERLTAEVSELNRRLFVQRAYSDELVKKIEMANAKNNELYLQWDTAMNDSLANKKLIDTLQSKLSMNDEALDEAKRNAESSINKYEKLIRELSSCKISYEKCKENYEKEKSKNEQMINTSKKLRDNATKLTEEMKDAQHVIGSFKNAMRLKDDEAKKLILDSEKRMKDYEVLLRKYGNLSNAKGILEADLTTLKSEYTTSEKERESMRRSAEEQQKHIAKMQKNMELMVRDNEKANTTISDLKEVKLNLEAVRATLDKDLKNSIAREKKASSTIKQMLTRIEEMESERNYLNETIDDLNGEIENKKNLVENMKKQMDELNEQLSYYKYEYNQAIKKLKDVRCEFQKCQEREAEVKSRWVKCKGQVDDANEKLACKLAEVLALLKKIKKMEKKTRELKRDLEETQSSFKKCKSELKSVRAENEHYIAVMRDNDNRFIKLKNQLDKMLREKDLIATQMLRKTDENVLLQRNVSLLNMAIDRGNGMYNERLDDINMMTVEIKNLRSQCNVLKRGLANTADMRHEVFQLHRKLNQERTRAKALEHEMLTPMNIHRWRKLGKRDPKRMELIVKCNLLQKKILRQQIRLGKSDEIVLILQKKVNGLEQKLAALPSFEIHEKLLATKSQLTKKTKLMKAAMAISRATVCEVKTKDENLKNMQGTINDLRCKLIDQKKEKYKLVEKVQVLKKKVENVTNPCKIENKYPTDKIPIYDCKSKISVISLPPNF